MKRVLLALLLSVSCYLAASNTATTTMSVSVAVVSTGAPPPNGANSGTGNGPKADAPVLTQEITIRPDGSELKVQTIYY